MNGVTVQSDRPYASIASSGGRNALTTWEAYAIPYRTIAAKAAIAARETDFGNVSHTAWNGPIMQRKCS